MRGKGKPFERQSKKKRPKKTKTLQRAASDSSISYFRRSKRVQATREASVGTPFCWAFEDLDQFQQTISALACPRCTSSVKCKDWKAENGYFQVVLSCTSAGFRRQWKTFIPHITNTDHSCCLHAIDKETTLLLDPGDPAKDELAKLMDAFLEDAHQVVHPYDTNHLEALNGTYLLPFVFLLLKFIRESAKAGR